MLINIKAKLQDTHIQELLEYALFPDPAELERTVSSYAHKQKQLFGYESEGEIIGLVGFEYASIGVLVLLHLAVIPEERGKGYGRGMLLELLEQEKPQVMKAETDEESVDFYRSIGFRVESLGVVYPNVERFVCTYEVENE